MSSLPDGWGFTHEYLASPQFLPAHVPHVYLPAVAPLRRAERKDLLHHFYSADRNMPSGEYGVALDDTYAVYSSDDGRNNLYGPARLCLSEDLLSRHFLVVGPPGTGKTTQVLLPLAAKLVADPRRTVVILDPKGDQFEIIREIALGAGRPSEKVRLLNLHRPDASIGWNPCRRGMTQTEAHSLATSLVYSVEPASTSSDSSFWKFCSVDLITHMLVGMTSDPQESNTLPRLLQLLQMPKRELIAWLKTHRCARFGSWLEGNNQNAETALVDAMIRLSSSLLDEDLAAVLSADELDIRDLFREPTVLVLEVDESRMDKTKGLFNMLLAQMLDAGIEAAGKHADARLPFPVTFVLDEFASALGAIPRLPTFVNTLRSRRISLIAAVQSTQQIFGLYGSHGHTVLTGFSSRIFFPNLESSDSSLASTLCGTMPARIPADDQNGGSSVVRRPVYLPEEVSRPPDHPALGRPVLLVMPDAIPVQVFLTPSYRTIGLGAMLARQRGSLERPVRDKPLVYSRHTEPAPKECATEVPHNSKSRSKSQLEARLAELKVALDFERTTGSAAKWWHAFEKEKDLGVVVRLAEELAQRRTTLTEWYLAWVWANTDNLAAGLHYLDYSRLKKSSEGRMEGSP